MPRHCLIAMGKGVEIVSQPTFDDTSFFPTTVNNPAGLIPMIQLAVGPTNLVHINPDITPERFPLGNGVRQVRLQVQPFLDGEWGEDCANRLMANSTLENTGELAAFMAQHPEEVQRWDWVLALGEASRWVLTGGRVFVPGAAIDGADRYFNLSWLPDRFISSYGVLVSRK